MLPKINFTETEAYRYLSDYFPEVSQLEMKDLFKNDPNRFKKMSITFEDILFDFLKTAWTTRRWHF